MEAILPEVPPETLAWRKRTGNDRFDEMWEGVLHMTPAPGVRTRALSGSWKRGCGQIGRAGREVPYITM